MNYVHDLGVTCPLCHQPNSRKIQGFQDYQIIQCNNCLLVYAWPRMIPADLYETAYEEKGDYQKYLELATGIERGKLHLTWAMKRFFQTTPPAGHLLDIGCSTGTFIKAAQERGWQVSGIEISKRAAQICRQKTNADVYTGTLIDFQPKNPYDAITAWEVLEHIPDPVIFIDTVVHMLKPGGTFTLSVPNWNSPWMRASRNVEHWPPYHLTFWDPATIRKLLLTAGLEPIQVAEKPFAWEEEVGQWKWAHLPIALICSYLLQQKGMHVYAQGKKP